MSRGASRSRSGSPTRPARSSTGATPARRGVQSVRPRRDLNPRAGTTQRPGEDAFRAQPKTYPPRSRSNRKDGPRHDDGRRGGKRHDDFVYPSYPYVVPFYGSYFSYPSYPIEDSAPEPGTVVVSSGTPDDEPHGFLRLRVLPRTADVYVDGALSGTVDDFGGSGERMLPAGTHRIELAAPGFARLTFDVRVPANDTVTFTRELESARRDADATGREGGDSPQGALHRPALLHRRPPPAPERSAGRSHLDDVRVIP